MEEGAKRLQKTVRQLLTQSVGGSNPIPGGIKVVPIENGCLRLSKNSLKHQVEEFSFVIRVTRNGSKEIWWPIQYEGHDGKRIHCESTVNGRILVNLRLQETLLELADTWAKTLEAQQVSSSVANALL